MPDCSDRWGFAPNPDYFFVLTQKSNQKKVKAASASFEEPAPDG
jgi:hypothetical protein